MGGEVPSPSVQWEARSLHPVSLSCLADLSKHKRYEIRVSVFNAVGEGPASAPQEVFVGEAGTYERHSSVYCFPNIHAPPPRRELGPGAALAASPPPGGPPSPGAEMLYS